MPHSVTLDFVAWFKAASQFGCRQKYKDRAKPGKKVQDLVISATATCYHRERWVTPDRRAVRAPLPRIAAFLRSVGVAISKRQLQRLLTDGQDSFTAEARDVLRAGLETAPYVSVDDTGARHKAKNGFCTQIGNDWFTWFGTRPPKSRLNFLDLLRAGHTDYVLNDAA